MAILIAHDLIYDSYMMVIWWLYDGQSVVIVRKILWQEPSISHHTTILIILKKCLVEQRPNQHARNDQWMSLRVNLVYSRQGDCRPAVGDLKNGSSVCTKSLRVDVDTTGFCWHTSEFWKWLVWTEQMSSNKSGVEKYRWKAELLTNLKFHRRNLETAAKNHWRWKWICFWHLLTITNDQTLQELFPIKTQQLGGVKHPMVTAAPSSPAKQGAGGDTSTSK